ncbi:MAG: hypothetical protein KC729_17320, partial [Candidatus Eisenbacteria bacterium]|nr:hypothetical protein [Candidatus Eisenbacteria bacterium]
MARAAKAIGDWPLAGGLVLLAWIHRLFFLFSNLDHTWPFTVFYEGDSETFYDYARAILNGSVYDGGVPFHPPAFPYFLSMVHTLIGAGPGVEQVPYVPLKIVMAFVGSLPIGLAYLIARPYLGRGAAFTGAMLGVYSFGLCIISVAPVSESLYMNLLLGALLVWTRKMAHPLSVASGAMRPGWSFLLGALLGLLCLTRAEGVLVALLLLLVGLGTSWRLHAAGAPTGAKQDAGHGSKPRSVTPRTTAWLRPWLFAGAAMVLVILPWTIRNAVRLHAVNAGLANQLAHPLPELVPITAYGPLNFALANNALADGTFSRDILTSQAHSATLDIRDPQHLEYFLHGYRIGGQFIAEHPGAFVRLVFRRWGLFFGSLRLGWTQWDIPGGLDGVRRPVDLFVPSSGIAIWIHLLLMLGGCAFLLRDSDGRRWLLIVGLLTGAGMVTTGLFFGYARLGVILFPLWFMLSGRALAGLVDTIAKRSSADGDENATLKTGADDRAGARRTAPR